VHRWATTSPKMIICFAKKNTEFTIAVLGDGMQVRNILNLISLGRLRFKEYAVQL
jgi:hypothetical protein